MGDNPVNITFSQIRPRDTRGGSKTTKQTNEVDLVSPLQPVKVDSDCDIDGVAHSTRVFTIGSGFEALTIRIPQLIGESYGTYVWPCAVVLAQYVWTQREAIIGKVVLEIGAGTALVGLTAHKCGGEVILSDTYRYPEAMENVRKSCIANILEDIPIKCITWGQFDPDIIDLGPVDIVLGSDCFYDTSEFEDVVMTVSYLLSRKFGSQFWCTYQERSANWNIEWLLQKWGLQCHEIPLPSFEADALISAQTVHLYIITRHPQSSSKKRSIPTSAI